MTGKRPGVTLANMVRHALNVQVRVPKMKWNGSQPTAHKGIYAHSSSLVKLIPQYNAELV